MTRSRTAKASARDFLPEKRALPDLRGAVHQCRGCELYRSATQAVFGEGPPNARLVLVGEQPGDQEDLAGKPFVGPSGKLLSEVLEGVGISRADAYVTNAVKHFSWRPLGKKRIHQRPLAGQIAACRPWLEAELEAIRPEILVCLGAVAVHSVFGRALTLGSLRGRFHVTPSCAQTFVTVHPSSILRAPDPLARARALHDFARDLTLVSERLRGPLALAG